MGICLVCLCVLYMCVMSIDVYMYVACVPEGNVSGVKVHLLTSGVVLDSSPPYSVKQVSQLEPELASTLSLASRLAPGIPSLPSEHWNFGLAATSTGIYVGSGAQKLILMLPDKD